MARWDNHTPEMKRAAAKRADDKQNAKRPRAVRALILNPKPEPQPLTVPWNRLLAWIRREIIRVRPDSKDLPWLKGLEKYFLAREAEQRRAKQIRKPRKLLEQELRVLELLERALHPTFKTTAPSVAAFSPL